VTFSLVARDEQTGAFGMAVASSSVAVAARCVHLQAGVGAVGSQNITDPGLGTRALAALQRGCSAAEAIQELKANETAIEFRQLVVIDAAGRTSTYSGPRTLGIHAECSTGHAAAAGNLLATHQVPSAMLTAYLGNLASPLERRLLAGLQAGLAAGGEAGPVRSAGLAVVADVAWRVTDLRVDDDPDPIAELARLVEIWLPQKADYRTRALDPAAAPSYGVAGDRPVGPGDRS
jgi:uncharacterized Ntn-hydrolase superfamily protein